MSPQDVPERILVRPNNIIPTHDLDKARGLDSQEIATLSQLQGTASANAGCISSLLGLIGKWNASLAFGYLIKR